MADFDMHEGFPPMGAVRQRARRSAHVQQARMMVAAAGLSAFAIVAVAAAIMTTLL